MCTIIVPIKASLYWIDLNFLNMYDRNDIEIKIAIAQTRSEET